VDAPGAAGAHALIRDGAKLVESVADVLEEFPDLGIQAPAAADAAGAGPAPAPGDPPAATARQGTLGLRASLSPEESQLVEVMDGEPLALDALIQRTGLAPARVSGALTLLELKGLVRALPGGHFALRKAT